MTDTVERVLRKYSYGQEKKNVNVVTMLVSKRSRDDLVVQKVFSFGPHSDLYEQALRAYKHRYDLSQSKVFANLEKDLRKAKHNLLRFSLRTSDDNAICIETEAMVQKQIDRPYWITLDLFLDPYCKQQQGNRIILDENIILLYLTQCLRALTYLHSVRIHMHDHLHENNVFILCSPRSDYLELLRKKSCVRMADYMMEDGNGESYDVWKLGVLMSKMLLAGVNGEYVNAQNFTSVEHDSQILINRVQNIDESVSIYHYITLIFMPDI